jgi:hypothetical protein
MKRTGACLIGMLALVALTACGGDRATAPDKAGVRATPHTLAILLQSQLAR